MATQIKQHTVIVQRAASPKILWPRYNWPYGDFTLCNADTNSTIHIFARLILSNAPLSNGSPASSLGWRPGVPGKDAILCHGAR